MLGPLLAFGLLMLVPQSFDSVFVVSFVFAILGVAMLALFVRNLPKAASGQTLQPKVTLAAAARLVGRGSFARLVAAASLVALFTISDGFVYLALQQRVEFDTSFFPLLYVATALVFMLLAVPVGVLGDRVGRVRRPSPPARERHGRGAVVSGATALAAVRLHKPYIGFRHVSGGHRTERSERSRPRRRRTRCGTARSQTSTANRSSAVISTTGASSSHPTSSASTQRSRRAGSSTSSRATLRRGRSGR
jgi:hypothetical protein